MGEVGEDSFVLYYLATGTRYYQSTNDVATLWLLDYGGGGGRFLCPYYLATGTRYYQSTNIGIPPGRKPVFHGHSVVAELQKQCNPPGGVPVCDGLAASNMLNLKISLVVFEPFDNVIFTIICEVRLCMAFWIEMDAYVGNAALFIWVERFSFSKA